MKVCIKNLKAIPKQQQKFFRVQAQFALFCFSFSGKQNETKKLQVERELRKKDIQGKHCLKSFGLIKQGKH